MLEVAEPLKFKKSERVLLIKKKSKIYAMIKSIHQTLVHLSLNNLLNNIILAVILKNFYIKKNMQYF